METCALPDSGLRGRSGPPGFLDSGRQHRDRRIAVDGGLDFGWQRGIEHIASEPQAERKQAAGAQSLRFGTDGCPVERGPRADQLCDVTYPSKPTPKMFRAMH